MMLQPPLLKKVVQSTPVEYPQSFVRSLATATTSLRQIPIFETNPDL